MLGLFFEEQPAIVTADPRRMDIACFVGFVRRRATLLPPPVRTWLHEQGWAVGPYARPAAADADSDLLDVPVPIDTWEVFDHLFAWEQRPVEPKAATHFGATYLGAAVRSFFAQGGRKCYVIRMGDPSALLAPRAERLQQLEVLLPGLFTNHVPPPSPADRAGWHGVGHLFGLPDVSLLCLPDVAELVGVERTGVAAQEEFRDQRAFPEVFVECAAEAAPVADPGLARRLAAPRCDAAAYRDWARAVHAVAALLARSRREVQLIAAVPLPVTGTLAEQDLLAFLSHAEQRHLTAALTDDPQGLASAFVQLVYPWMRTPGSADLPEQLESPDGVLTGLLARNAVTRGAFRSAAGTSLGDVYELLPILTREQMLAGRAASVKAVPHSLLERVSLGGPTATGWKLLSDVTTSLSESYRPASVNRLVAILVRAARIIGEENVFAPSGERLWGQVRQQLKTLLSRLLDLGALRGASAAEAFQVRCDRSTMSQHDLDEGRVIAEVTFNAALPIERITVALAMEEGGRVSLLASPLAKGGAA